MKTNGLTDLEVKVMEAARHTDFGDCLEFGQWSFSVADAARMDTKVYRGVVSSLIKKGLVSIWDDDPDGRDRQFDPYKETMVFEYTDKGKSLFEGE
jgi:hypothetical protein